MINYGGATEGLIARVERACVAYGSSAIIALAGVPGTGKSFVAAIAAQRVAGDPLRVREVQFHQSFAYEEFIEGMRLDGNGSVSVQPGVFLEWNDLALDDPDRIYVILIEELTRANVPSVMGELLTYIEHRERSFLSMYSRRPIRVAPNLIVVATYNPVDRSALELDNALLRRLRIINVPPSGDQLVEMLVASSLSRAVLEKLKSIFSDSRAAFAEQYDVLMPFGHGVFATVLNEKPDLYDLWEERIKYLLRTPRGEKHPFFDFIAERYPWKNASFEMPSSDEAEAPRELLGSSSRELRSSDTQIAGGPSDS